MTLAMTKTSLNGSGTDEVSDFSQDIKLPENPTVEVGSDILKKLRETGSCTLCHGLVDLGFNNTYVRGINPLAYPDSCEGFVGRARTLRFAPLREDLVKAQYAENTRSPHRVAIESIQPGEVLVIDTGGCMESGVVGDIFTLRVFQRGGAAIVIDGVLRDLDRVKKTGLPVYAKGIHGAGIPRAQISVGHNEPVRCGGVCILPGDILVGDRDGVIAIPPHMAQPLADTYHEKVQFEKWISRKIRDGGDLHYFYQFPPRPEVYDLFRKEVAPVLAEH